MVLGCFNWCSAVLGGSGCFRKFTRLFRVVVGCFSMFPFVSSRSACLGSTRFFRLYLVVMVRNVLLFYVFSIVISCFRWCFMCLR